MSSWTPLCFPGESLRRRDFTSIELRDSPVGRQAYLLGTRLAVWQVASLARSFKGDATRTAAHLEVPAADVAAALAYAAAYPVEIEAAIVDNTRAAAEMSRLIPGLETIEIDAAAP